MMAQQQLLADDLVTTRVVDEGRSISYRLLALELGVAFNVAKQMLFAYTERFPKRVDAVFAMAGSVKAGPLAASLVPSAGDASQVCAVRLVRQEERTLVRSKYFEHVFSEYVHAVAPAGGVPAHANALYAEEDAALADQLNSLDSLYGANFLPFKCNEVNTRSDARSMLQGKAPAKPVDHYTSKPSVRAPSAGSSAAKLEVKPQPTNGNSNGSSNGSAGKILGPSRPNSSATKPATKAGMASFFKVETDKSKRFSAAGPSSQQKPPPSKVVDPFDDLEGLDEDSVSDDSGAFREDGGDSSGDDAAGEDIAGAGSVGAQAPASSLTKHNKRRVLVSDEEDFADEGNSTKESTKSSPRKRSRTDKLAGAKDIEMGDVTGAEPVEDKLQDAPKKRTASKSSAAKQLTAEKREAAPRKPKQLRAEADAGAGKALKIKRVAGRRKVLADEEEDSFDNESDEPVEEAAPKARRGPRLPQQSNTLDNTFASTISSDAPARAARTSVPGKRIVKRRVKKEIEFTDADGYTVFDERWTDEEVEVSDHEEEESAALRAAHEERERSAKAAQAAKQATLPGAASSASTAAPGAKASAPKRKKAAAPKNASILSFFAKK